MQSLLNAPPSCRKRLSAEPGAVPYTILGVLQHKCTWKTPTCPWEHPNPGAFAAGQLCQARPVRRKKHLAPMLAPSQHAPHMGSTPRPPFPSPHPPALCSAHPLPTGGILSATPEMRGQDKSEAVNNSCLNLFYHRLL